MCLQHCNRNRTCDVGIFRSADGWNHGNRGVSHDYAFRFWYCERYGDQLLGQPADEE